MTPKSFGFASLTCLVAANMIGAGVFTTSGFALADLGSPRLVMLAWIAGGVIALCGALSYAGLVRAITESGGEYVFLSRILHPAAGFVAGWISLLAGFTGAIAFAALACEAYLDSLLANPLPQGAMASLLIVAAGLMHAIGVSAGARTQNVLVLVKLALLIVFIALMAAAGVNPMPEPPPTDVNAGAFAGALVWIALSYSGFNAAVYVADEAVDAETVVPRALIAGTLLVFALYLAFNAVLVLTAPFEAVAGRADVALAAARAVLGPAAASLVGAVIILALVTSVSSMTMAGPRVYAKMADDGLLPAALKFDQDLPRAAIALQSTLALALVWIADLRAMLSYLGFTLSLSAALTVACVFVLRGRSDSAAVRVWAYPLTPALFVLATITLALLAAFENPIEFFAALATIGSGLVIYAVMRI